MSQKYDHVQQNHLPFQAGSLQWFRYIRLVQTDHFRTRGRDFEFGYNLQRQNWQSDRLELAKSDLEACRPDPQRCLPSKLV